MVSSGVVLTFPRKTEVSFEEFEFEEQNDGDSDGITIILLFQILFALLFEIKLTIYKMLKLSIALLVWKFGKL